MKMPSFDLRKLPSDLWMTVSQIFVGLFFMGASLFKINSYLVTHNQDISNHFQFWMDNKWPLQIYQTFIVWVLSLPYGALFLEAGTITCQMLAGLCLVTGRFVRSAAAVLLFIQLNIFLGTFHNRGFNEFVGFSIWLALFYLIQPRSRKAWFGFTFGIAIIMVLFLYNRYLRGDAFIADMEWQILNLQQDILSFTPKWKEWTLSIANSKYGSLFWVAHWWVQILLIALLFTRFRLQAGAALLVLAIGRSLTWMNSITSQGVLTVLTLFVWTTVEEFRQRTVTVPVNSGKKWSWKAQEPVRKKRKHQ